MSQNEEEACRRSTKKKVRTKKAVEVQEEEEKEGEELSERCVLRGIFKMGKKSHDVLLTKTRLSWTPIMPESPTGEVGTQKAHVLLLQDVYAVKVKRRRTAGQQPGSGPVLGVALLCCKRKGRRLEDDAVHLHNASSEHTHIWYNALNELLKGFRNRPKYLKVFINPSSHKKEAVHIYREHVAPLFKIADVRTDITVTEKKGHTLMVMMETVLDEFDGVVCVGGDGSVAEVCHSLVLRAQLDAGSPVKPVRAALPLGIIPAGSTDIVSCSVHGVRDPVTATLHILLGHLQQVDMCSFSSLGQVVRYGFAAMFGFGGRSLARSENNRWMPSSRRKEYAVVKTLARLRPEDCQLKFLPAKKLSGVPDLPSREQNAESDESVTELADTEDPEEESWVTKDGLYLNIIITSIPCVTPHAPHGLAPATRLSNGSAELITVGDTSRSEFFKHLKRYNSSSGQFHFTFVSTHTVSAVKLCVRPQAHIDVPESDCEDESRSSAIIPSDSQSFPWNIDGELVEIAGNVVIRVHPSLITLYGEEVDQADETIPCNCF
ncbi:ceramide kinase-like protein [Neosynchiropus ocellatus]